MPTDFSRRDSRRRRSRSRERDRDRYEEDRQSRRRERDRSRSESRSPGREDRRYRDVERKKGRERDWDLRPPRDVRERNFTRNERDRRTDSDQDSRYGGTDSVRYPESAQYDGGFVRGGFQVPDGGMFPDPSGEVLLHQHDTGYDSTWDRHEAYHSGLSAGLSDDFRNETRGSRPSQITKPRQNPSATLYLKGIPEDKQEGDIFNLLQAFPNVKQVRVLRDRSTGQSRGYAFVDFETVEDAMQLMDSEARYHMEFDGYPISFEYSTNSQTSSAIQTGPAASGTHLAGMDWICGMCAAVNFARRLECYQCSSVRPKDPQRVTIEPDAPSNILKISALDPNTSEETLHYLFSAHAPVKDLRVVRDKFSGAPRGFGFVHFHSIADASRVLNAVQGAMPEGQQEPLRLCFARDKAAGISSKASMANDALEAAQAMQQYSSWEPKQFNENALDPDKEADGKDAAAGTSGAGGNHATPAGFVYDAGTGYWYDSVSGYYYDANTGLYYHSSTNLWYAYDQATGEYKAVTDSNSSAPNAATETQAVSTSQDEPAAPGTTPQPAVQTIPPQASSPQASTASQQALPSQTSSHPQDVQSSVAGRDDASLLQAAQTALNQQFPLYTQLPLAQQLLMQQLMVQYIQAGQYMQHTLPQDQVQQYATQQQQLQEQMQQVMASLSPPLAAAPQSSQPIMGAADHQYTAHSTHQSQPTVLQHPSSQPYTAAPSYAQQQYHPPTSVQPHISTAAQNAIAVAEASVAAVQRQQPAVPAVVSTSYKPPIKPSERKRGAVIGAAAKLDPERLAARAQMEKERAEEKQQEPEKPQPQRQPPPTFSSSHGPGMHPDRMRQLQSGNGRPGIGSQPPAKQFQGPPSRPTGPAPRPGKPAGAVQGVIHRGKWSQRLNQG